MMMDPVQHHLHDAATWSARTYLKCQHPPNAALLSGLAVLGLLVILRIWLRRKRAASQTRYFPIPTSPSTSTLSIDAASHPAQFPCYGLDVLQQSQSDLTKPAIAQHMNSQPAPGASPKLPQISTRLTSSVGRPSSSDAPRPRPRPRPIPRPFLNRVPPAPPLTPPELSPTIFHWRSEPRSLGESFMDQPNPDYLASTTTPTTLASDPPYPSSSEGTTRLPAPRRRSYLQSVPRSILTPPASTLATTHQDYPELADVPFAPSSYPPTRLVLPPAPPNTQQGDISAHVATNMAVRGEIFSMTDAQGAGWTRHTRVYGGGVCLACAASGGTHGGSGGFYGATVTPEEMRH